MSMLAWMLGPMELLCLASPLVIIVLPGFILFHMLKGKDQDTHGEDRP